MSVRHDWYQTEEKVVVTVMLKNAKEKNYHVDIEEDRLHMTADNYELDLKLFAPINVNASFHQDFPTKVEITLLKRNGIRWTMLERKSDKPDGEGSEVVQVAAVSGDNAVINTPLPAIHKKDWDSLARDVEKTEEEEAQNEEALRRLFCRIYSTSSPEIQKAMNKSFWESGGTVLSTNWSDVSKGKVDVRPPEGSEFRKWE